MQSESASRQEFDEVEARYRQAEASRKQALAMVDASRFRREQAAAATASARVNDADSRVVAPFDGIVTTRFLDPGSLASPGAPLLKLDTADSHRADIQVPESRIHSVTLSQAVLVTVPAAGDAVLQGMVQVIEPSADPSSRSFTVQVAIPDHASVRPGMFCRVDIPQSPVRVLTIPQKAIRMQGQLTALMLVDPEGLARFRVIRTGRVWEGQVEVLSGLKPGDRYVVEPPPELQDGMRVEVRS
jgi:RND family efflux transporter MFP subunit